MSDHDDQRDEIEDDEDDNGIPDPADLDDETDDDADDPWEGKSADDLKAELRKTAKKLGDANRQAQSWREKAQGKTPAKPPTKTDDGKATFTKAELEEARREALDEARTAQDATTIKIAARSELKAAGLRVPTDDDTAAAAKLSRALRLLDLESCSVEDGEVLGLTGAIDTLREEMPELFGKPGVTNGRRPAPNPGNTGGGKGGSGKAKTATEQQAAGIFGG